MKLAIGSDHAGYAMKEYLREQLTLLGHEVKDYGTYTDSSVDYPDYVHPLAEAVGRQDYELGILLCGSANGVAMTANKHQGIRAAIAWQAEIAALARQHNDANILCIPARFVSESEGSEITHAFLNTSFEGGRHERRVRKIANR